MNNEVIDMVDGVNLALIKLDYVREQGPKPDLQKICKERGVINIALVREIAEAERWDLIRKTYLNKETENIVTESKYISAKNNLDILTMTSNLFKVSYVQLKKKIEDGEIIVGIDDITKLLNSINKGDIGKFENMTVDNSKNITVYLNGDPDNMTLEQLTAWEQGIKNGNRN